MAKIVIITGFTGSGKSGLAVEIAKRYNGEIISCDSVQIYKRLNIGSAKITDEEMQGIKHYLIDILEPNEQYSVGQFVKDCESAINEILSKGKTPILVGGTGLYIKALLNGYNFNNADKNEAFRQQQYSLAGIYGNQFVWDKLNKIAPDKASSVHPNNLKRVVRYLEIETFGQDSSTPTYSILSNHNTLAIGLVLEREQIYDKINKRVDIMLNSGLKAEVKGLLNEGLTLENNSLNTIGYREMVQHLQGEIDYDKCVELIKQHTRNYCKRQLTFMKTMPNLILTDKIHATQLIEEFLNDNTK